MLGFIGGTGPEGKGLAIRFAAVGEEIIIGSRTREKAEEVAMEIIKMLPGSRVASGDNMLAAEKGDPVFLTVPYQAQKPLLESLTKVLSGKTLVHVVVPIAFEGGMPVGIRLETSAAEEAQQLIPKAKVVSTLKDVSAMSLLGMKELECDVVVCGDHGDAKEKVIELLKKMGGIRAFDGGPLRNSRTLEAITPLLLYMNKRYGARTCLKIQGL